MNEPGKEGGGSEWQGGKGGKGKAEAAKLAKDRSAKGSKQVEDENTAIGIINTQILNTGISFYCKGQECCEAGRDPSQENEGGGEGGKRGQGGRRDGGGGEDGTGGDCGRRCQRGGGGSEEQK